MPVRKNISKSIQPDKLIRVIRQSFVGSEQVYTQGSCVMFYLVLKTVFPKAKPYWSKKSKHMITRIGTTFYDITGKVDRTPDYVLDDKEEYSSLPVAVAFPQKKERRHRPTTTSKL